MEKHGGCRNRALQCKLCGYSAADPLLKQQVSPKKLNPELWILARSLPPDNVRTRKGDPGDAFMTAQEGDGTTANAAMQRYWNEVAGPRWVGRQAVQEARNVEMAVQLLQAAAAQPGERVLDIGVGTGVTTVPHAQAVGPRGMLPGPTSRGRCSTRRGGGWTRPV